MGCRITRDMGRRINNSCDGILKYLDLATSYIRSMSRVEPFQWDSGVNAPATMRLIQQLLMNCCISQSCSGLVQLYHVLRHEDQYISSRTCSLVHYFRSRDKQLPNQFDIWWLTGAKLMPRSIWNTYLRSVSIHLISLLLSLSQTSKPHFCGCLDDLSLCY